jgi:FlaA1/EpsC-like NDP-sugar epimerase
MKAFILRMYKLSMPRWVVFNIDILLSILSMTLSIIVVSSFRNLQPSFYDSILPFMVFLLMRIMAFIGLRTFEGILRYTSVRDALRLLTAIFVSSGAMFIVEFIFRINNENNPLLTYGFIIFDSFVVITFLSSFRLLVKFIYQGFILNKNEAFRNVVIYGAGEAGVMAKQTLDRDKNAQVKVIAFIDNAKKLQGKTVDGCKIYHINDELEELLVKLEADEILIAIQKIKPYYKKRVIEIGLKIGLKIMAVPPIENWINGTLSVNQLKNLKIEDLLQRDEIVLDFKKVSKAIKNQVVLVTGAAGSIGSEIVKQLLNFNPNTIVLLDQGESQLFELQIELQHYSNITVAVADVCNPNRMERVFKFFQPTYVFHAAAYKHVPLMEDNPYEAINTNIFGTRILANLSVKYGVKKFVFISTDKAVNPTNIMGATKRVSEVYVQSLNAKLSLESENHTKFITTRFGNVLGSNGSVIPIFKKQIEAGGPVTVTHPEITRYFMTIPEACQLVLEAGVMGSGGEIFIFDMGESVKIVDLAKKMIRLYGLNPDLDIDIVYSGLRPGEKLKEELLGTKENTVGTYNPKIMIATVDSYNYLEVNRIIDDMYLKRDELSNQHLVTIIKGLLPEYISNNSIYQKLDQPES